MLLRARACLLDVIQALSWMPRGASKLRISAQYALGIVVLRSFPDACLHSIRAMVVKQGIVATDAGKGELNSALSGLGQISGIVMPGFFWGPLFRFFGEGGGSQSAPWWLRWGPGGHYFVSALMMVTASLCLRAVPGDTLSIDDAE